MKKISFLLVCSFLFLGCASSEEEGQQIPLKKVPLYIVQRSDFTPTITFSGTLLPQEESDVATETSGNIFQVWGKEGDAVSTGQTLLSFSGGNNLSQVDLVNAQTALSDAEKSLSLTYQQTQKSIKSVQLAVAQAQSNLDSAKRTNYSTGTSTKAQLESAKSSVSLSELNLENAKTSYTELLERLKINEKNLNDTKNNAVSSALTVFRKVMSDADKILGVNPETKDGNNSFEVYLGFHKPQTKIDSVNLFRTAWNELHILENIYAQNQQEVSMKEMEKSANAIRTLLQRMDDMLKQSVSGIDFPEATLTSLQTQNSANRSTLDASISALTTAFGQIETFIISKPQQIRAAELAIEQAKKQYTQSQSSFSQIKSGTEISVVGTENQVENAKNALLTAKSQLDFSKKQNELAIQQAISSKNTALANLRRAQAQAGKLSVRSPINGIIIHVYKEAGDTVTTSTALFTIADINTLVLKGEIEPNMLADVHVGSIATVEIEGFENKQATVSKVYPVADTVSRRIPIEVSLPNADHSLPANIFAKANISLPTEKNALLIPQNALVSQNPPAVFVVAEGEKEGKTIFTIEKRKIQTGRTQHNDIEVLEGLFAGEYIIPRPIVGLKEGDEVEIQTE